MGNFCTPRSTHTPTVYSNATTDWNASWMLTDKWFYDLQLQPGANWLYLLRLCCQKAPPRTDLGACSVTWSSRQCSPPYQSHTRARTHPLKYQPHTPVHVHALAPTQSSPAALCAALHSRTLRRRPVGCYQELFFPQFKSSCVNFSIALTSPDNSFPVESPLSATLSDLMREETL